MAVSIIYRTADPTRWGAGKGANLTAAEFDQNNWNLAQAVAALQTSRPQPNNIASITVIDTSMTIFLQDGTAIGPLMLPVLQFRWRGAWAPNTVYRALDTFAVDGFGLYMALLGHTSGAAFDPLILQPLVTGTAALQQMLGSNSAALAAAVIYDMGFYYPGRLSDSTSARLFELPMLRKVLLPVAGAHRAYMITAPSVSVQVLPVYLNTTQIGTITVAIGANLCTVAIFADTTYQVGDLLSVGLAGVSDASAAGLSVMFAAQRLTT